MPFQKTPEVGEKRFHKTEDDYSLLFNNSSDAVITTDLEDIVTSWNKSAEKLFGWKAEEAIGKKLSALIIPPTMHDEKIKLVHDVMAGKAINGFNTIRLHKNRSTLINVDLTLFASRNSHNIIVLHFIFKDLSERKIAENASKEIRERMRDVMNLTADAIILADASGNITSWSRGAQTIFQYPEDEVTGKTIGMLIPGRYRIYHEFGLKRMSSTGRSKIIGKKIKLYGLRKNGTEFPIELSLDVWNTGKTTFYISTIHDLSENKKTGEIIPEDEHFSNITQEKKDEKLPEKPGSLGLQDINNDPSFLTDRRKMDEIQSENMRFALAKKVDSEFLAGMSHELRTPLNSIIGFCELLKQKKHGDLTKKQEQYLDKALSSSKSMLGIIDDFDLRMMEAGKIPLVIEKMSVSGIINETLALLKKKVAKQNIILKKNLDPKLEFVEADKKMLSQVLFNLLSNAIKFSKNEGGVVTIATKKEGGMAKFQVSDTGIGIREEHIRKLFDALEHVESNGKLGLAITKRIIEMHGGTVSVESKYGEGSTFTFTLPISHVNLNDKKAGR